MTLSKQLFLLLLIFPLLNASEPIKCASSYRDSYTCEKSFIPIRFPLCDHPEFNLQCNNLNKPVLTLPMSGTFLVKNINYDKQQIYINDLDGCLVKRLLTFNLSGSPFSTPLTANYTFFTCPNEFVKPYWSSITCLSNSTTSFYASTNFTFVESMLPSCQIVKTMAIPVKYANDYSRFSTFINDLDILLEWKLPECRHCEMNRFRCGFKNKTSLQVECFVDRSPSPRMFRHPKDPVHSSSNITTMIIGFCVMGGTIIFIFYVLIFCKNQRFGFRRTQHVAISARVITQQPVIAGLDQTTIDSYKRLELGNSIKLPGPNGLVCPICLSEYVSKETVRFIPECDHCFHVHCIDPWLKIHGSCPICRNSHS